MNIARLREIWREIVGMTPEDWASDEHPEWVIDLEDAAESQDENCSTEQACLWAYLCFDLDSRPRCLRLSQRSGVCAAPQLAAFQPFQNSPRPPRIPLADISNSAHFLSRQLGLAAPQRVAGKA